MHGKPPRWEIGQTARAATAAVLVFVIAATGFTILAAVYTVSTVARATGRVAVSVWRRLGVRGRLIAGMVCSPFVAITAGDAGLMPAGDVAAVLGGLGGVVVFGGWMLALRYYGQWRWRQGGGVAVNGSGPGWRERADANAAGIAALNARMDDLFALMAEDTGLPQPGHGGTGPMPRLRLIRGGREAG
jgi:hypothetical protein